MRYTFQGLKQTGDVRRSGLEVSEKTGVKYPEALKVCQKRIQFLAGKIRAANSSYRFNVTPLK